MAAPDRVAASPIFLLHQKGRPHMDTARRGKKLIKDIEGVLDREHGTTSLDFHVLSMCKTFRDSVLDDPSEDTLKYIVALDTFVRCLKIIDGPLMKESRRICLKSCWQLDERRFFRARKYPKWIFWKLWGVMTGYGDSVSKIAITFGTIVVICILMMAIWPNKFNFSIINHGDLATAPEGQRWWFSTYIAGCHALLVSTEIGAPLSIPAQAMVLGQTLTSVILLALAVSTIMSRIKQDS